MRYSSARACARLAALLMAALLAVCVLTPFGAFARASGRIVRVGWFESPFNSTDALDRRSGYAYEYQQRIATYTGWTYEYVRGSWPELLQMLIDGRIDLLSDVSYTEARAERMLYSALPMGTEKYFMFAGVGHGELAQENYAALSGLRVGVNKGSVQADMFRDWARANGVDAELIELTGSEDDNLSCLNRGDIDIYVTLDAIGDPARAVPLWEIGASDFFFAVSKNQPDILSELNMAMNRIQEENPYFNQKLYARYIQTTGANLYLGAEERAWLDGHGPIRVGYQDNYLAFCARDPQTGALTGALKDYLAAASDCLKNAHLTFEAVCYPTATAALQALKRGELDCVFPANLTDYDGEVQGFFMTPPLMRTDMSAVIRISDLKTFHKDGHVTVAVNAGNTNYDMFLLDYFPEWRSIYFKDTPECLRAIADGKADCLLMSSYRFNNIADLCRKYKLTTVSTGVEMDYCFAVNRESLMLYSILSKITGLVPAASVNSALSYYFTEDARDSLGEMIQQNLGPVGAVAAAVALTLVLLVIRSRRAEKAARAGQRLIAATQTDPLTGLYNRDYFYEYARRFYRDHPGKPMDAVAINIEHFHTVNALNGRAFGDHALHALGGEISAYLKESAGVAGRSGADDFLIYCPHLDEPQALLNRMQGAMDMLSVSASVRLRMGVVPWQEELEPTRAFERALTACNLAHGSYKERLRVFDDALRERMAQEQRLISDLRHAVESRELVVYYQPKYDITTNPPKPVSAEALIRWQHPELGLIAPDDFIPLFERNGQIGTIDKFVWAESARQVAAWREKYGFTLPVSVNLSRMDLFDLTLEGTLDALIAEHGLQRGDLKLEIPETACAENGWQVIDVIRALRKKGYEIEMDNFGEDSASLNLFSHMPIDVLKVDRSFVTNIQYEERDLRLVELILSVARKINVPVIAEGVETAEQLELLVARGCALAQGFYFAQPMPAETFEAEILNKM